MIELTTTAKEQIDAFFADKDASPIRIYLAGGCSGPRLSLALDEPGDADEVLETEGYRFVMEKELYGQAKPVTVDFGAMGFEVLSSLKIEAPAGGGCGSCCGGCSC